MIVLIAVTALLLAYGTHPWSWLAGPIASLLVWSLDRSAHEPPAHEPAAAPSAHVGREPAPVD
jgi:hypothetical protein